LLWLVIPAKAGIKGLFTLSPAAMRFAVARHPAKAGIHVAVAFARHPREGGDPGTFHAFPGHHPVAMRFAVARHPSEKLGSILLWLLIVIPAKAGIQGRFMLYRSRVRSNSQSFRPSKAGRVTFLC
jgi:hypothetical protein